MDNIKKIKRTAQLISILTKYGFETLISQTGIKKLIPDAYIEKNDKRKELFSYNIYERIRMALEELGPTYIKLGQLLSNRDDILPEELTKELQKLQDNVSVEEINVPELLKKQLSTNPEEYFDSINLTPIAAASLSQVYIAVLKGNEKVILKIKREGIRDTIEADLLIMKDFSKLLENHYEMARKIGLVHIVEAFEKSIISELSFTHEFENIERFRKNFANDPTIHVPYTYKRLSNNNILCMEFIDGIKISDRNKLIENGLNVNDVAHTVVDLYLKQVIVFGFFHADPHSGNIFVLKSGKIVFIDYGSVGKLYPADKENISNLIIYALRKDVKRLIGTIKKMAIKYSIDNDNKLERDAYEFLDIIDNTSVKDLDFNEVVRQFNKILNENQIILPDYIYLLARGIVLLEGIGRELDLEINIMDSIKPYAIKIGIEKLNPKNVTKKTIGKLFDFGEKLDELPNDIHSFFQKINNDDLKVTHHVDGIADIKNAINRLAIAIIIAGVVLASSLLILSKMPPLLWDISVLGLIGILSSMFMSALIIVNILRNKKEN